MLRIHKPSKIVDWWIAPKYHELKFVNILLPGSLKEDLVIVGHPRNEESRREIWTSTNKVAKITRTGVMTEKGTFYPFKEAHGMYIQFLIEVNKANTVHAYLWDYASHAKDRIIADVTFYEGYQKEDVTFDCKIDEKPKELPCGYSKELKANVVFSPFSKRNFCTRIHVPTEVILATYSGAKLTSEEFRSKMKKIRATKKLLR